MIKNVQIAPNEIGSTKSLGKRHPTAELRSVLLGAATREGKGPSVAETEQRKIRSFGSKKSFENEAGNSKVDKKITVMIKKAVVNPTSSTSSNEVGRSVSKKPGSTESSSPSTGAGKSVGEATRVVSSKSTSQKKNGQSTKGERDLRSFLSLKDPERSLISPQNLPFLRRFVTEQGKILSRRLTRVTARQQREITKAIKQARILGYLQFVNTK